MCDRGGGSGSGSGSPEDENPLNRRIDTPSSSEDEGRMVRDANARSRSTRSSNSERNYLDQQQRNFPEDNRSIDTDEELEDCNCNVGRLRQAVSSNFQLEREIRFAEGALAGLRESCAELHVPADHPSIENLQSAYDAVVSPESCWNRHGTTYHERALARFREPQEFAAQQGRLSEAINQVQPQFGPEANSLIRWQEDQVPSLQHIPPRTRAHERGVRDAICREHAEPFLNASAQNQENVEAAGYGRCPQNMASLGLVQQRVGSMADDDPMLPRYLPVLSDMQGLQRQRSAILDEHEAAVCSNCQRQLDPEYPGYTPAEERELNRELLADPRRCARNNEMIPSLVLPHLDQPPQGRDRGPCADLNETMALPPGTLSDFELVYRQEADEMWVNHTPRRPNWQSYTVGSETFPTHPPECRCARDPDCNCAGCNTDRRSSARADASGAASAEEAAAAAAAAAAEEAAAAQEAAAAAEAARVAAEQASDARLRAIRAQHLAARQAGAPVAASRDFSTVPTTRPDTPRRPRTRAAQRALAAQSQCGAGAAPAPAAEPEAGMEEALLAEQAASAAAAQAATEARFKCLKAKRLADKAARPPPARRSERIKRKRVADTGVEEPGCPPGCACADCVADRDNQQGPCKRPPRGGGGGCGGGGAGGCGGSGVSA